MTTEEKCGNCRFVKVSRMPGDYGPHEPPKDYTCCRFPPIMVEPGMSRGINHWAQWPRVGGDYDWCGEWREAKS